MIDAARAAEVFLEAAHGGVVELREPPIGFTAAHGVLPSRSATARRGGAYAPSFLNDDASAKYRWTFIPKYSASSVKNMPIFWRTRWEAMFSGCVIPTILSSFRSWKPNRKPADMYNEHIIAGMLALNGRMRWGTFPLQREDGTYYWPKTPPDYLRKYYEKLDAMGSGR